MGRGRCRLSHGQRESWSLSPGIESQIGSSHEEYIMVGPVMRSTSRWVQSVSPVSGSSREKQVMRSTKSTAIVLQL
jgi:hypothetical protein